MIFVDAFGLVFDDDCWCFWIFCWCNATLFRFPPGDFRGALPPPATRGTSPSYFWPTGSNFKFHSSASFDLDFDVSLNINNGSVLLLGEPLPDEFPAENFCSPKFFGWGFSGSFPCWKMFAAKVSAEFLSTQNFSAEFAHQKSSGWNFCWPVHYLLMQRSVHMFKHFFWWFTGNPLMVRWGIMQIQCIMFWCSVPAKQVELLPSKFLAEFFCSRRFVSWKSFGENFLWWW